MMKVGWKEKLFQYCQLQYKEMWKTSTFCSGVVAGGSSTITKCAEEDTVINFEEESLSDYEDVIPVKRKGR